MKKMSAKLQVFYHKNYNFEWFLAMAAESRVMKRELDFKMEQLNERRAELKQDTELIKQEKVEVSRQKDQLKRDEERLRAKYADFLSDTAEGRTALEGNWVQRCKRLIVLKLQNESSLG